MSNGKFPVSNVVAMLPETDVEPMTLGNMRENGVRSLLVYCKDCHHSGVIDVEQFADDLTVPSFNSRVVCQKCGAKGDARPNWKGQPERETLIGSPRKE